MKKEEMMDYTIDTNIDVVCRVREIPVLFFGSVDRNGAISALKLLVDNFARDVRQNGGDKVTLRRFADGSYELENNGPGCPIDNWQEIFTAIPVAPRGRVDSREPWDIYMCAVQCVCRYMDVTVWQGGAEYSLRFEKGYHVGGLCSKPAENAATGTKIRFLLDREIFPDIMLSTEECCQVLEGFARGGHGLNFVLLCDDNS